MSPALWHCYARSLPPPSPCSYTSPGLSSLPWVHHSMARPHSLLPMVLLMLLSPFPHPSHPTAGLSISPQQLSGYREPGVPSAHPSPAQSHSRAQGSTLPAPQSTALQRHTNIGFLIHYQFGGCHAVFGLHPSCMDRMER